ncbi:hypothetical protein [Edwardsiella tarda]|uniref:Uncharacterized protein n=2 Tax=Edwardsiella tarda TaxID=636 RepID=A0AC61TN35_EDWTA|nr:hypothetical protein [Edwardsiella tarda]UAL58108.1 hypothetical protein K8O98_17245 [Edwardsiella tarda]UCQ02032.1 hypothetical protein DCL27_17150 [Edwardsiella tarda ATCC 15947 = NBRC 105688]
MINKLAIKISSFIGLLFVMTNVEANIQVSPINITLSSENKYSGSVRVFSNSDKTMYIKTSVKRIVNPGTPKQQEVPVASDDNAGVIASPQRFIISGQGSHLVRILPINIPQKEGVYRVYISTVPSDSIDQASTNRRDAQITINVIWGVLVYVTPEHKIISFSYDNVSGKLKNTGNVHVRISAYDFCYKEDSCQWKTINRAIYPDMNYKITDKAPPHSFLFIKYQLGGAPVTLKVN